MIEVKETDSNESLATRMFWQEWTKVLNENAARKSVETRGLRLETESNVRFAL